jgi:hypothetical protein
MSLQAGLNVYKEIDTGILFQTDFFLTPGLLRFAYTVTESLQGVIGSQRFGASKTLLALGTEF